MRRPGKQCRGVAQPGSAPALGAGGRAFKSPRPDQRKQVLYLQCPVRAGLNAWKHCPEATTPLGESRESQRTTGAISCCFPLGNVIYMCTFLLTCRQMGEFEWFREFGVKDRLEPRITGCVNTPLIPRANVTKHFSTTARGPPSCQKSTLSSL